MTGKYYSYINSKCEVMPHTEGGCGVFVRENIKKDKLISLWGGCIISEAKLVPSIPRFTQWMVQSDDPRIVGALQRLFFAISCPANKYVEDKSVEIVV
jgi:hypothetical protein